MSTTPTFRAWRRRPAIIGSYLKRLRLPAIAREYQTLARDTGSRTRATSAICRPCSPGRPARGAPAAAPPPAGAFPRREAAGGLRPRSCRHRRKEQVLELAQGSFDSAARECPVARPEQGRKTHLLLQARPRRCCLRGLRLLFRIYPLLAGWNSPSRSWLRKLLAAVLGAST